MDLPAGQGTRTTSGKWMKPPANAPATTLTDDTDPQWRNNENAHHHPALAVGRRSRRRFLAQPAFVATDAEHMSRSEMPPGGVRLVSTQETA